MRIYKLSLDTVKKYRDCRMVASTRSLLSDVINNFNDWLVEVTRYDNVDDNDGWQYKIEFKNIILNEYEDNLENRFNYNYFLMLFPNVQEYNNLTPTQIAYYLDTSNLLPSTKDTLQHCYRDYNWQLNFMATNNTSVFDWYLMALNRDGLIVHTDKLTFEYGLEILNESGTSNLWEPHLANPVPASGVEKVVGTPRTHENVWYLSKRQLRDYYDNMSTYNRKVEQAIHNYDNYCVRIEKTDDAYTLIIDKMQPTIVRNFYSATIDRHTFNTILGINSDENASESELDEDTGDCDSDEDTAHRIEDYFLRTPNVANYVNGFHRYDRYRRYLTKDEFEKYVNHLTISDPSQVNHILNHYEKYIAFISKESVSYGTSYKLNVIDTTTNALDYWDGFADAALEEFFGFDSARDARMLDSMDNINITPREYFAEQYMQRPTAMSATESSNATGEEESVSDEIRTIDQLVVALDKLRQQRVTNLDNSNVACASNMDRHEQYDYDDHMFDDNLLVNIDNLINSLNIIRRRSDM